jgi:hypothetical protein
MTSEMQLFEKRTVAELTDAEMMDVDGGTWAACAVAAAVASSLLCGAVVVVVGVFAVGVYVGYNTH